MSDHEALCALLGRLEETVLMDAPTGLEAPINPDGPEAAAAIRELLAEREEMREALAPFGELADWIGVNRPSHDREHHEVQIEGWPYTLSVGWLQRARQLTKGQEDAD